ncbi:fructosamine kinase family protein [Zunongwangia sp. HGR-M22]|uniref:fructosamine kinase family protein n=1 Tax=Zunongwangia sp. HGR-M22 TaxID=3015168 RepID=UPI0022DE82B5|nr:fructosamine kinase family protein [Zunongwangia sp. HGR-M22]WBL25057.1 fructosamine kinase family protein [Zunongwangia sp. HGR-M22]
MSVNETYQPLFKLIEEKNDLKINNINQLSGGDINIVFLLNTSEGKKVIKINSAQRFPGMFEAEMEGMKALKAAKAIDVPKMIDVYTEAGYSCLLMDYRETGPKSSNFWTNFGKQIADLHRNTQPKFGFSEDNYIGSLPQQNKEHENIIDFYIKERLQPQFKLAKEQGYSLGDTNKFCSELYNIIPQEKPALIHGDLWNGNYLVNAQGNPCLIDPAVAYAPREMDLSMMKLFGGFDAELFNTYSEEFPLEKGFENRISIWQLYYLLVHLNLFGTGYLGSCKNIIERYT